MRHNHLSRLMCQPESFLLAITLLALFLRVYRLAEFPPSFNLDEAWDAYNALRVTQTGTIPIFFPGDYGREPLMICLQAIAFFLWGANAWALRVIPALVGVLTVPAIYRVTVELFRETPRAKWLGALAAGMLAISFWHLDVSRLSFRVIFVPLFSALATWAFWRGWTTARLRYFALAGALIGAGLYTYPAARFIPVTLAGFAAIAGIASLFPRARFPAIDWRNMFIGFIVMAMVAGILFAPLAIYYLQHPGQFALRTGDVSIFAGKDSIGLGENIVRVARMFIDRGDLNVLINLPGRPALDLLGIIGFWIGILIALTRFTSPRYLLLLIWIGLNLLPTVLTVDAPHFLRAINALPAIIILATDGLTQVWARVVPKIGWMPLVLIAIIFGGVLTYHGYFDVWGASRATYDAFEGSLDATVARVMTLSQTSNVIVPLSVYGTPQMQFALAKRYPQDIPFMPRQPQASAWFVTGTVQRTNIVLGPEGVFIPRPLNDAQIARLKTMVKSGQPIKNRFGDGVATQVLFENAAEFVADIQPARPLDAQFGDAIRMFGYALAPATVAPGEQVWVTLYWQALRDLNSDYFVSVNLIDAHGESFAQRVSHPALDAAPTSLWRRGAIIPDAFDLRVPADAHIGKYRLEISLLDRTAADLLLPLTGATDRLLLDPFTVARAAVNPNAIKNPVAAKLGDPALITLLGYDLDRAGESLSVALYWKSERAMPKDYSVFIHLLDANDNLVAQHDSAPQNGNAPTSWWLPGDLIADSHELILPNKIPAGRYTLAIGTYDSTNGARLPLFDANGARQPNDAWQLPIELTGP
jgi:4-amino-4-deoxy-L-arabinose transferase-like glycosyltransferase